MNDANVWAIHIYDYGAIGTVDRLDHGLLAFLMTQWEN